MEREVIVLDAVYSNVALILQSHMRTQKGNMTILYNAISDTPGEELYPVLEVDIHVCRAGLLIETSYRTALDRQLSLGAGMEPPIL